MRGARASYGGIRMPSIHRRLFLSLGSVAALFSHTAGGADSCDRACLEHIADQYRAAYLKHDPALAPVSKRVRFTENNVEMLQFPDASWDTVTQEIGPALTFSDPQTGNV